MRARSLIAGAVAAAAFVAGCGGGDGGGSESGGDTPVVAQPKAEQPLADQVEALNEAIADQSCEDFTPLLYSLTRSDTAPGAAPNDAECRRAEQHLRTLTGVEFTDSAEYGTGGLSQSEASTRVAVWTVDRDGVFRVESLARSEPQIDTSALEEGEADQVAGDFVDAVGSKDCRALRSVLYPEGRLVAESGGQACDAVINGELFAPALAHTPGASHELLGETRNFAFAGVPTADAYFTLVLFHSGRTDGPKVLDVVPSTAVDLPEE
jgi:hypothetical protein